MKGRATQDYLKAAYDLSQKHGRVSTSALAEHLGVRPSSVTAMIKKLSAAPQRLLDYQPHRGVVLTKAGRRLALWVTRRHRLIEQFLVTVLGYGWDEVHEEADLLEHCVSETFVDRIDGLLHYPRMDPHGHPIPNKNGDVQEVRERPLSDVPLNKRFRVSSVGSEEAGFLKYLTEIGLTPNATVKVSETVAEGSVIRLALFVDGVWHQRVISFVTARKVFVSAP
ncbi:MAG: metal-dependent transcriptional regulator [Myxococcota bacterium]|nr:metal-dependent transcriptional regulator [Myxococcota bacterium]